MKVSQEELDGARARVAERFATKATPQRCGGDFEGELLRSAFGASFGVPLVADRVRLRVQVEGVRRPLTLP